MPNRTGGRIYLHNRQVDNEAVVIGSHLEFGSSFKDQLNETMSHGLKDDTRRNYRQRIASIIRYLETHHPEYYDLGTREVTTEELHDKSKYYFGSFGRDLVYSGLNVNHMIAFLMHVKIKPNGKLLSYTNVRKFKDAILWGAKITDTLLPMSFHQQMERFLNSYKKEEVQAKKIGNVDERSADPIPVSLYKLILEWTIDNDNVFAWFWTVSQWNCMARSASIDPLGFHNSKMGLDSIRCTYDDSKADKDGEKFSEKNIFANPFSYRQCWWTAAGLYFCINSQHVNMVS